MKNYFAILLTLGTLSAFAREIPMTDESHPVLIDRKNIKDLISKKEFLRVSCSVSQSTKNSIEKAARTDQEKITTKLVTKSVTERVSKEVTASVTRDVSQKLTEEFKSGLRTDELKQQVAKELKNDPSVIQLVKQDLAPILKAEIRSEMTQMMKRKYPYENGLNKQKIFDIIKYYDLNLIITSDIYLYEDSEVNSTGSISITSQKNNVRLAAGKIIPLEYQDCLGWIDGGTRAQWSSPLISGLNILTKISEEKLKCESRKHHMNLEDINNLIFDFGYIQPVKRKFTDL